MYGACEETTGNSPMQEQDRHDLYNPIPLSPPELQGRMGVAAALGNTARVNQSSPKPALSRHGINPILEAGRDVFYRSPKGAHKIEAPVPRFNNSSMAAALLSRSPR